MPKHKRWRIWVDGKVQGGMTMCLVSHWVATAVMATGLTLVLQFFMDSSQGIGANVFAQTERWVPMLLAFAVTMPIVTLNLVRFSHRFAGPLVRLRRGLAELAEGGQPAPLKFRDGDYWQDLADDLGRAASRVQDLEARLAKFEGRDPNNVQTLAPAEDPVPVG